MPQKRNSQEPPPVMTWGRAAPVLVISAVFDAVRFMFEWFIFFGPALAAIACTAGVNTVIGASVTGVVGQAVAGLCATGAGVAGFFGVEFTAAFGIIMAMVTGFAGWLTVGLILLITNARIFKENALWFAASLLVSEVPFVGSIPAITIMVWRLYRTQIRVEKEAMKKYEKERSDARVQERNQRTAEIMQAQTNQLASADVY